MNQYDILVADIGGTNARFAVVHLGKDAQSSNSQQGFHPQQQITLKCAEHPSIAAMAKAYCQQAGIPIPAYGCLAIAGPIENGLAKMTNLNWAFRIEDMRQELGMQALDVINDFAALAYATPFLRSDEIKSLHPGKANPSAAMVVMGPGTGFGMAGLVPDDDDWKILPTEGGHCNLAPGTETELAIRAFLARTEEHVSIEDVLSGRGLVSIYRALADRDGVAAEALKPADVSNRGLANEDPLCREALVSFCELLGSVAGDKALSLGAKGGVFLGGGIIPKIADFLPQTAFCARFEHKGPMRGYVSEIPVNMIINDVAALVGTAAWLVNKTPQLKAVYRA